MAAWWDSPVKVIGTQNDLTLAIWWCTDASIWQVSYGSIFSPEQWTCQAVECLDMQLEYKNSQSWLVTGVQIWLGGIMLWSLYSLYVKLKSVLESYCSSQRVHTASISCARLLLWGLSQIPEVAAKAVSRPRAVMPNDIPVRIRFASEKPPAAMLALWGCRHAAQKI